MSLNNKYLERLIEEELHSILNEQQLEEVRLRDFIPLVAAFLLANGYADDAAAAQRTAGKIAKKHPQKAAQIVKVVKSDKTGRYEPAATQIKGADIDVLKGATPGAHDVELKEKPPQAVPSALAATGEPDELQSREQTQKLATDLHAVALELAKMDKSIVSGLALSTVPEKMDASKQAIKRAYDKTPTIVKKALEKRGITTKQIGLNEQKITKDALRVMIAEELQKQTLDEVGLKGAAAGAMLGLSALGGGKAVAAPPQEKAPIAQKAASGISDDEAFRYGQIINYIFNEYSSYKNQHVAASLKKNIEQATGSEGFPTKLSPLNYQPMIIENPKIIDGLETFKKEYGKIYQDAEGKFPVAKKRTPKKFLGLFEENV